MNGDRLILERQPLEEYAVGWADVLGEMNSQGYFTQRAPVQNFERGKTIYQHKPIENCVARFLAYSDGIYLVCSRSPGNSYPRLGGILRAEGTPRKSEVA